MYGGETWTLSEGDVRQLHTVQQCHLSLILNIHWDHFVSSEKVLKGAGVKDIKTLLILRTSLRWQGHVCRIDHARAPKQLMMVNLLLALALPVSQNST